MGGGTRYSKGSSKGCLVLLFLVLFKLLGLQILSTLGLGTLLLLLKEKDNRIVCRYCIESRSRHGGYSQFTPLLGRELVKTMAA